MCKGNEMWELNDDKKKASVNVTKENNTLTES